MSNGVTPEAPVLLRAARRRIARPERWTKGSFRKWNVLGGGDCECVNGALIGAAGGGDGGVVVALSLIRSGASLCLSLAARARGFESASRFNDDPKVTHADVLELLDEAAALAELMLLEPT